MMFGRLLLLLIAVLFSGTVRASHVMGAEITWKCNGNNYVFELVFYRNCNEAEVNVVSENLKVWNHPSLTNITVNYVGREDISPVCTPVTGSPSPLSCGSGPGGGNGNGAIEKITYRSGDIVLNGVPPAAGWIFTFENFSRNGDIDNLVDPATKGLTVIAKMFPLPNGVAGVCRDNSPSFLQNPYLVSCVSEDFNYSMNAVDIDLDSINVIFGTALNNFPSATYVPGVSPAPLAYETGFSPTSPTPDATMQPGNIAAQVDPQSGELTFLNNMLGNYVVKLIVQTFRNGQLIAEIDRELQVVVLDCSSTPGSPNTAPDVVPPFAGSFETTVNAGDLVTFNFNASDIELLQDGTPQNNTLTASGLMFGTNFTSTTGCINAPCATLNQSPPITNVQGASAQFSWQTDCSHTEDVSGNVNSVIPYHFVFKVQDNYCQIPKTTFRTVTINVVNPGLIPATQINCISTAANGDITVSWDAVSDPNGTFVEYRLNSVQDGLLGTYPIATTSAVVPAPLAQKDFFVTVVSGCNANALRNSDTLSNVFLVVQDPADGTAKLIWNLPSDPATPLFGPDLVIEREYPTGTWTVIATLPYNDDEFIDTIDICSAFLNYRVSYSTPGCSWSSNIAGGPFEDQLTPTIPVLESVSVDTATGNVVLTWNQNNQPDTYGYVVYYKDETGAVIPFDTVWGIANTTYSYDANAEGPVTYTVAAFDSCFTDAIPPTYQTSAKATSNTSIFLTRTINLCENIAELSWTDYIGWANTGNYVIFMRENNGPWQQVGSTAGNQFEIELSPLQQYSFTVRLQNTTTGAESFSNLVNFSLNAPEPPEVHYLRVASVSGSSIVLRHQISIGSNVKSVVLQRYDPRISQFQDITTLSADQETLTYTDYDVDVQSSSYRYRAVVVDSCGLRGAVSNTATSILLKVTTDQTGLVNYLNWNPYSVFDGGVLNYKLYRSTNGFFNDNELAILDNDQRFYEDDISELGDGNAQFCYVIIADEGDNQYGFFEEAYSNIVCASVVPLVYIPNAIYPGGINKIFIPVVSFADVSTYEFTVFDRWGQPIFETKDINEGWDGTHKLTGELVEVGLYNYVVKLQDGQQQEYVYRGHVSMIR